MLEIIFKFCNELRMDFEINACLARIENGMVPNLIQSFINFDIWIANHKPKLIKDLYEYLKKDPVFLQCLIGETLTGGNYFKNNKQAIATHMLSPTTFVEMDAKYAAAMVKKTKIDIRAKSRDGISSISFRFDVKA